MCGIFAVVNDRSNNAAQTVMAGLRKLEYRGYDSWGIAMKRSDADKVSDKLEIEKHIGKIGDAKTSLPHGSIAIGHTRWATHGGVTDTNAHPHYDCKKKIAVIHNGIVENHIILKEELLKKGHKFISGTDTEVIAHLIEEKQKTRSVDQAVFETFNQLVGSNAIGIIELESEKIIACRNGSPLVVGIDEKNKQYFLGSDVPAFLKYTNEVYFLKDGEATIISKGGIKLFDLNKNGFKELKTETLDWKLEDAEKSGYPHFLIKEIMEQTTTIPKTASVNTEEIERVAKLIRDGYKVALIGCGTAAYCALAGKYLFAKNGISSEMFSAYEFLPFNKFINKKTVAIAISQSGETADTLIAVKEAKKNGAKIVAVVNARGSTLERLADFVLSVGAGPEIAVVSTKALTSQLSTIYLLLKSVIKEYDLGKKEIEKLGRSLKELLSENSLNKIVNIAKTLISEEHMYLIGKHLNYPAALEFALKLKETSYMHAEAFAAGELKHGVIALIQKGTPCFVLASQDETKDEVLSSAAQLKARGAKIIGIAPFNADEFDITVKTPDLEDLTIFGNIIVGQILGYYLGVGRGCDPDKPRNLAKSVTVK